MYMYKFDIDMFVSEYYFEEEYDINLILRILLVFF